MHIVFADKYWKAEDAKRVGAQLRATRLAANLQTVDAAKMIGVRSSLLSKFEHAEQELLCARDRDGVNKLCEHLKLPLPVWRDADLSVSRRRGRKKAARTAAKAAMPGVAVPLPGPQSAREVPADDTITALLVLYKRGILTEKAVVDALKKVKS